MWNLRQKKDGTFFLTYDKYNYYHYSLRGIWEYVGPQDNVYTIHAVRVNQNAGYLCCNDDEGNVRVLVLEENV